MNRKHSFIVPHELDSQRLDRCLAAVKSEWTRSRARKLIDAGNVTVDGRFEKPSFRVTAGSRIEVDEPEPAPSGIEPEELDLDIVFEDRHLLVLNKAAGMVVHPAAGNPTGTLVNALLHHCHDLSGIGGVERPGIVHRLDKDTTGLMIVAKTDSAHRRLSLAFRRRQIQKTYLAAVYGSAAQDVGEVNAPLARHPGDRKRMAVVPSGRPAHTLYEIRERYEGAMLVACRLITGRTHQIRVHMAHIGHAVIGDPVYSGRQWRNLRSPRVAAFCRDFPRQALHSWRLKFVHPATDETVAFESPLPEDFAELLAVLRSPE